jgi:mono/diheme cytochrome c family protein
MARNVVSCHVEGTLMWPAAGVVSGRVRRVGIAALCVGGLALAPHIIAGQSKPPREDPNSGGSLYRVYCASCHGASGKGDGVAARTLTARLPDLTTIAQRRGGVFPRDEITAIIDGRTPLPAHQRQEMPIWGTILSRMEAQDERAVQARLTALVSHLESLQVPAKWQ